jgi:23S rRNA pseudouridine1911/1915/1917 synthase
VIEEQIPAALHGERLDRIVALIADLSRSDAAALVAAGGAVVDGEVVVSGKLRLHTDQVIVVDPSLAPQPAPPQPDPSVAVAVVHDDADVIVVDKPAGLVVHPGAGNSAGTLVNGLLARYPELEGVGEPHRPGIVHRLDVGTSGLLVVARTQHAYRSLVDKMAVRDIGRTYLTLVWGVPANPVGVIEAPIGRDHRDPLKMAVVVDGKPARTHYRVLREFTVPAVAAFVECRLETGRTHQIRVHLAAVGHPVVGDAAYGGVRSPIPAPRPFLHAAALSFEHPTTGEPLQFESPLPDDLASVLASLS